MGRSAKIVAYNYKLSDTNGCSDYSLNMYWGNDYRNVFYLCGDIGRSEFSDTIETETDVTGQTERIQNTTVERFNITAPISSPLLQFLKTIDKHDVKELHFLDTGDVYTIKNIDINDDAERLNTMDLVTIVFEDEAITKTSDVTFDLDDAKLAFWDNNNDGTQDIDGEAQYENFTPFSSAFNAWQLYYESDGVTPATSGDVLLLVYAVTQQGLEALVGVFEGQFTDAFTDATKWQSTQNIWDYFNVGSTVGHTNKVQFNKRAFAEDNGYFSDELENRAVDIRFDLSIDGSTAQPTTLSLVYTVWGAFHSAGVQSSSTSVYGYTTTGKINQKNTLNTISDVRTAASATTGVFISSAVLTATNNFSNTYELDTMPVGEHILEGAFTTPGGYIGQNLRGAFSSDNYTLAPNDASAVFQVLNILNFTLGGSPFDIQFNWKYDRQLGLGGFSVLGDITAAGAAQVLLDGVLVNTLPTILPSGVSVQYFGSQIITLPDTQTHNIRLEFPTTTGYTVYTEFEVQLKSLF